MCVPGVPGRVPDGVTSVPGVPGRVPDGVPGCVPAGVPGCVPGVPGCVPAPNHEPEPTMGPGLGLAQHWGHTASDNETSTRKLYKNRIYKIIE